MEHVGNERKVYLPLADRPNPPEECDAIAYYDVKHGHFGSIPTYKLYGSISLPHLP